MKQNVITSIVVLVFYATIVIIDLLSWSII